MALIFDQVSVKKAAGYNLLSAEEWLRMPLREQYDLISQSRVQFLMNGETVRTLDAVKSMARHRAVSAKHVPMAMLFSARTWADVIFRDELLDLHGQHDGFDLVMTLTRETENREGIHARRVDSAMVMHAIDKFAAPPKRVYICGSNSFVDAASNAVIGAGIPAGKIRTERYGG